MFLFKWGVVGCFLFPTFAWSQDNSFQPLLGTDEFVYHPLSDAEGHPIISIDGTRLYEGVRLEKDRVLGTVVSYQTLVKNRHLHKDISASTNWIRNALTFFINSDVFAGFLQHYQQADRAMDESQKIKNFFSGSTEEKAEVLTSLLLRSKLVLTDDALAALRRSYDYPSPEPMIIPISVEPKEIDLQQWAQSKGRFFRWMASHFSDETAAKGLNAVFKMTSDIQAEELSFDFKEKTLVFDPHDQVFRLRLKVDQAILRGPVHNIGEVRYLNKIYNAGMPIRRFDEVVQLKSGTVHDFTIDVGLAFERDRSGMWRFRIKADTPLRLEMGKNQPCKIFGPETPCVIMTTVDPRQKVWNPDTKEFSALESVTEVELVPSTIKLIESVLSDTLTGAFKTFYFAEDLAFLFPLQDRSQPESTDISLQTRLSKVKIVEDGLELGFDARLLLKQPDVCIETTLKELQTMAPRSSAAGISLATETENTWILQDDLLSRPSEGVFPRWETKPSLGKSEVNVHLAPEAMDLLGFGLWTAGRFCVTNGVLRNLYSGMPLTNFHVLQSPRLSLGKDQLQVRLQGKLQFFERNHEFLNEKFIPLGDTLGPRILDLGLRFETRSSDRRLESKGVFDIQMEGYKEAENEILRALSDLLHRPFWTYQDLGTLFFEDDFVLKDFLFLPNGAQGLIEPQDYGWFLRPPRFERLSKQEISPTLFVEKPSREVRDETIHISWKPTLELEGEKYLYSWRLVSDLDRKIERDGKKKFYWSDFSDLRGLDLRPDHPGIYSFEVKAMNSFFEIEKNPASVVFHYRPPERESPAPPPVSSDWSPPKMEVPKSESPQNEIPPANRMESKGFFGCQLRDESEIVDPPDQQYILLLLGALGVALCFRQRPQGRTQASRRR